MAKKEQRMIVLPYTPRIRLKLRTLLRKGFVWYKELLDKKGLPDSEFNDLTEKEFDEGWDNYAMMCIRISGLNGDAEFELASPDDSSENTITKYLGYLDTENIQLVRELEQMILDSDKPHDPEKAPTADNLDPEV